MVILRGSLLVQGSNSFKTSSSEEEMRPNVDPILYSMVPLSFWGGVDPLSGTVIDRTHPWYGRNIARAAVALPSGRGSCTASQVMLELILNGFAPSIIITMEVDPILCVAAVIAQELIAPADEGKEYISIPSIYCLEGDGFQKLGEELMFGSDSLDDEMSSAAAGFCRILTHPTYNEGHCNLAYLAFGETEEQLTNIEIKDVESMNGSVGSSSILVLTPEEQSILNGTHSDTKYQSKAHQLAMRTVVKMAKILQAKRLIPISQAHIGKNVLSFPCERPQRFNPFGKLVHWQFYFKIFFS
jgi:predicted aconitase with swiveling domain